MSTNKILIVASDHDVATSLGFRLSEAGYWIATATDGLMGTRRAMEEQPDLILMERGLVAGDGRLVYEQLNHIEATSSIPIVLLCGDRGDESGAGSAAVVSDSLCSPYETATVLATVRDSLARADEIV